MLMMGSPKFLSKLAGPNHDWLADQALWLLEFNVTGQSERWERTARATGSSDLVSIPRAIASGSCELCSTASESERIEWMVGVKKSRLRYCLVPFRAS